MSAHAPICTRCGSPLRRDGICSRCMLETGLNPASPRPPSPTSLPMISTTLGGRVPERFGDYELVEEIAHGGMGVVYLARQVSLERFVALKFLLRGKHTAEDLKERFRREAKAAAGLRHPHIVVVHEVGIVEDQPFFSMDFIEGRSLAEALREGPLPPKKAAIYCRTIAGAMDYAHERWVLHRDLKPSNVLIDLNDRPHITDFGLAGKMEVRSDLTLTGQMLGSPGYLSPEQAAGRMHEVTAASDIYSIGAILYECLVGRPPFLGESLQDTLIRIREEDPVPPTLINPALPRDLETICLKCLEKESGRRYPSARALADDLGRWMRNEPIHARPASVLCHATKWIRRNPKLSSAAGLTAAALVAFSVLVGISNQHIREFNLRIQKQANVNQQRLVHSQLNTGNQLAERGSLAAALLWYTEAYRSEAPTTAARTSTHLLRLASTLQMGPRLQHVWFGGAAAGGMSGPRILHRTAINDTAFSEDGRWLAFATDEGRVEIREVASGQLIGQPLVHEAWVQKLAFAPGSARLATLAADGRARVWEASTGKPLSPWLDPPLKRRLDEELTLEWHPDGQRLLISAAGQPQARLWAVPEGRLLHEYQVPKHVLWAAFAESGTQVMTAHEDQQIHFWDAATGRKLDRVLTVGQMPYRHFLSPDGRWLALTNNQGWHHCMIDLRSGQQVYSRTGQQEMYQTIAFSADSRQHVLGRLFRDSLHCETATGAILRSGMDHDYGIHDAAFEPSGRFFATAGLNGSVYLWNTREGDPAVAVLRDAAAVTTVCFSPDGRHFCTGNVNGVVRLWDLGDPAQRGQAWDRGSVERADFHPKQDHLAYASLSGRLEVKDHKTGQPVFPAVPLAARSLALHYSPDGRFLAVSLQNGEVRVLDAQTGRDTLPPRNNKQPARNLAWSPDGHWLAAATPEEGICRWNIPEGQAHPPLEAGDSGNTCVVFSPDGQWLAAGGQDHRLRLYSTRDWQLRQTLETGEAMSRLRFSPDSRHVLMQPPGNSEQGHACRVWETATGREKLPSLAHEDSIETSNFSPGGRYIATGSRDSTLKVWDAGTAKLMTPPMKHEMQIRSVVFSPDETVLASGSNDRTARLWDVQTGEPLSPPLPAHGFVHQVFFHPSGESLFAASGGGLWEWRVKPDARWTADDYRREAQLMTGLALNAAGEFVPLPVETLKKLAAARR